MVYVLPITRQLPHIGNLFNYSENLNGRDNLQNQSVEGRITLILMPYTNKSYHIITDLFILHGCYLKAFCSCSVIFGS